jgi:DnaJ-domain-containing protein 1
VSKNFEEKLKECWKFIGGLILFAIGIPILVFFLMNPLSILLLVIAVVPILAVVTIFYYLYKGAVYFLDVFPNESNISTKDEISPEEEIPRALAGLITATAKKSPGVYRRIHFEHAKFILKQYAIEILPCEPEDVFPYFEEYKNKKIPIAEMCEVLKNASEKSENPSTMKKEILRALIHTTLADNKIEKQEFGFIKSINNYLKTGLNNIGVKNLVKEVRRQFYDKKKESKSDTENEISIEEAYEILDLSKSSSIEEVEKAYKKKASKYHPDNFDLEDETAKEMAEEKMLELNRAYKLINEDR